MFILEMRRPFRLGGRRNGEGGGKGNPDDETPTVAVEIRMGQEWTALKQEN